MKGRTIAVIGGSSAGPAAAAKAKRVNPAAEVTLFEASETVSYGICEAPYAISGLIADESKLVSYTPERLREEKNIAVRTGHYVEKIIPSKKHLVVKDLRGGTSFEHAYTHLVVATGSSPRTLGLPGEKSRNVFHLASREDTVAIMRYCSEASPSSAVIIGGGYIGMEMCEALLRKGLDVTLLHRHSLPMAGLEQETRETVVQELESHGVHFVTNVLVESLYEERGSVRHIATNRGSFEADIVILSLGVAPNVRLARAAKIRMGPTGAIGTDERQQTSADGIYAAGDCSEVRNMITGKPMYLPLATLASRAGWVAGENAAGGREVFKGAIRAMAVKIFDREFAQVGLSSAEARSAGFSVVTDTITAYAKVGIMPGSGKTTIISLYDKSSGKILGANVFGGEGSVLRANTLGVAIQHGLTADAISRLDLIYAPPFAPLWDPILVSANQARKKLK
jgi:NADPH-dependent 2,4-dienoyl-CoA reductase/sulfur reductase-like enzyme